METLILIGLIVAIGLSVKAIQKVEWLRKKSKKNSDELLKNMEDYYNRMKDITVEFSNGLEDSLNETRSTLIRELAKLAPEGGGPWFFTVCVDGHEIFHSRGKECVVAYREFYKDYNSRAECEQAIESMRAKHAFEESAVNSVQYVIGQEPV